MRLAAPVALRALHPGGPGWNPGQVMVAIMTGFLPIYDLWLALGYYRCFDIFMEHWNLVYVRSEKSSCFFKQAF